MIEPVDQGSIHGRFQPFHLGHFEYLKAAAGLSEVLWVGITQPETNELVRGDDQPQHRFNPDDNPLTFWERLQIIEALLLSEGFARDRFRTVPFPIERPHALTDYVPTSVTAFTTIYDDWNRAKAGLLREQGFEVQVLWERSVKNYSGGEVRRLLREGDVAWERLVPAQVAGSLRALGVPDRMRR